MARAVEHGSGNTEPALADPDIVNGKVDARDRIVDGLDSPREVRQVPVCRTELLKRHRDCYPLADEVPQLGDHLLIAHWPSLQNYCFPCRGRMAGGPNSPPLRLEAVAAFVGCRRTSPATTRASRSLWRRSHGRSAARCRWSSAFAGHDAGVPRRPPATQQGTPLSSRPADRR